MIQEIRALARRKLSDGIRKPLGALLGPLEHNVARPIEGLLFDLQGGRFKADGCVFEIPKDLTTRQYRSCFYGDSYEAEERALIKRYLRPTDRVLEFGACLGIVSCITNKLLEDKTGHVVVEANPTLIPWIYKNRDLNKAGFLIEHCAISDKAEETFYLHPVYIVGGTSQRKSERPVRLPGRSLRDLDARYGPFTTLIIDIEGSEREAFEGSQDVLAKYRLVIAEIHPWAIGEEGAERCREILRGAGLRFMGAEGITEAWLRE